MELSDWLYKQINEANLKIATLTGQINSLESASGYSVEDLIWLFSAGYTLSPPEKNDSEKR